MGLTNASVLTNDGRAVLSFDPDNPNKAATVTVDGTEYTQGIDGLFAGSDGSIWSGETPGSGMTASAGSQLRSQMGNILNSKKVNNETIDKCHMSVGRAIFNTSVTIIFGFSILVLSNFIPTIYFGIFTGLAMLIAMLAVLTLLPKLILVIKPFK